MGKKKSKAKQHGSSSGSNDTTTSLKRAGGIVAASGIANASADDVNVVVEVVNVVEDAPSAPVPSTPDVLVEKKADGSDVAATGGGGNGSDIRISLPISTGNEEAGMKESDGGIAVIKTKMGDASSSASAEQELTLTDDASFAGYLSIELNDDNENVKKNIGEGTTTVFSATPQPNDAHDILQPSNDTEPTQYLPIMGHETIGVDANSLELKSIDIENEGDANSENRKKIVRWTSTLEEVMSSSKSIKGEENIDHGEGEQWIRQMIKYMNLRTCCCKVVHHDNSTI